MTPAATRAGVFVDGASDLIYAVVPAPSAQQKMAALDSALAEMASVGLTGVSDAGIDLANYKLYRQYADAAQTHRAHLRDDPRHR